MVAREKRLELAVVRLKHSQLSMVHTYYTIHSLTSNIDLGIQCCMVLVHAYVHAVMIIDIFFNL